MLVVLRADASVGQGTGHVMRCLTLAEALIERGHEVHLVTAEIDVPWLADAIDATLVQTHICERDSAAVQIVAALKPAWIVIDSYRIPAVDAASLTTIAPILAIVDGDARGLSASVYLDQNLGAETTFVPPDPSGNVLLGSRYALIRRSVLAERIPEPWRIAGKPRLLCFMGGTDPTEAAVSLAAALTAEQLDHAVSIRIVAPCRLHERIRTATRPGAAVSVLDTTPELPKEFASASTVVSAAGTSAWDLAALGIPAVLVAVADNQQESMRQAVESGVALGVDAVGSAKDAFAAAARLSEQLLQDEAARRRLSLAGRRAFDGLGASRVAAHMEQWL